MYTFGLEALYMLVLEYPETLPLFTGFIIPYWDYEHLNSRLPFLKVQGWSDNRCAPTSGVTTPCSTAVLILTGGMRKITNLWRNPERYTRFKQRPSEQLS